MLRLCVALLSIAPPILPQAIELKPRFETASIKLDPEADGSDSDSTPGLLRAQMTLRDYVAMAYGLRPFQVTGGPSWAGTEHYAIEAKLERGEQTAPSAAQPAQPPGTLLREALQLLLAERFQLKFHREPKEMPAYALMVSKGGFKLQPTQETPDCGSSSTGHGNRIDLTATCIDMAGFANVLARRLQIPVTDETHVQGAYTFTIEWARDDLKKAEASDEPGAPSLFTVLDQQFGLKLEPKKAPADIIVIDRAERPKDN